MKTTFSSFIIFSLFITTINAQISEVVNPKGKWFFGAEIGSNNIISFTLDEDKSSIQGGLSAEYYFAKQWSVSTKLKYFKTGVSFYNPGSSGGFIFPSTSTYSGTFKGAVISIPLIIKWEFKIYKNIRANLKFGTAFNTEIESEYSNYSNNLNPEDYSKSYAGFISGIGFNYFLNSKSAVFLDFGTNISNTSKGKSEGFFGGREYNPSNRLISIGFKYNFVK